MNRLRGSLLALLAAATLVAALPGASSTAAPAEVLSTDPPHVVFYNLDDLRDAVPGGVDPLDHMPKTAAWMAAGTRYRHSFVVDPACCPSRASMFTGRYPHNNGVRLQSDGPALDAQHTMACYLAGAGYQTYLAGKFLTSWPRTQEPPCFDHSTVLWSGYRNSRTSVDGTLRTTRGYSTSVLGSRGREYVQQALADGRPFLLYEAPQAPHWVTVQDPDGTTTRLAVPEPRYADAPVGPCAGPPEADRSDKPAYVRRYAVTTAEAQRMCASQLRAIMTADDEFDATMRLLADRGVLDDTLVIVSSDNGYMWGDHGRTEKFVPYEPSIRVPLLLRWPGHVPAGVDQARLASYLDILPTVLEAAGVSPPAGAPALDGESLLQPSRRTSLYAEYYRDPSNDKTPTWRMLRTRTIKYVQTSNASGAVTFREYYRLDVDPLEMTNVLADGNPGNDPSPAELDQLASRLAAYAGCVGPGCVA